MELLTISKTSSLTSERLEQTTLTFRRKKTVRKRALFNLHSKISSHAIRGALTQDVKLNK